MSVIIKKTSNLTPPVTAEKREREICRVLAATPPSNCSDGGSGF